MHEADECSRTRLLCDLGEGVVTPGKGGRQLSCTGTAAQPGNIYSDLGASRWFSPTDQSVLAFSPDTAKKGHSKYGDSPLCPKWIYIALSVPGGHDAKAQVTKLRLQKVDNEVS